MEKARLFEASEEVPTEAGEARICLYTVLSNGCLHLYSLVCCVFVLLSLLIAKVDHLGFHLSRN